MAITADTVTHLGRRFATADDESSGDPGMPDGVADGSARVVTRQRSIDTL